MKWWFSDYDGTINLNLDHSIDEKDKEFIFDWVNAGNKFVVATGRVNTEVEEFYKKIGLPYDYLVCNNGCNVYDKQGNLVNKLTIEQKDREAIVDLLGEFKDIYNFAYTVGNKRMDLTRHPNALLENDTVIKGALSKTSRWEEGSKDILENDDLNIVYLFADAEQIEQFRDIASIALPNLKIVKTHEYALEIMNKKASKAAGIVYLQKENNIDVEDIVTSGDGENDIEMLELTNNSFAMYNHQNGVDDAAEYLIRHVYEIADYIDYK